MRKPFCWDEKEDREKEELEKCLDSFFFLTICPPLSMLEFRRGGEGSSGFALAGDKSTVRFE
uniref:Uncharacterized protein n=1 Tax=Nelumbo nucifera TaxID=4432 RepID=A0A822Z909_NELNU|nr:TPA_asm: hypothetical protein HUJ06_014524 [Nelumbo nucifera]